nr:DIE2/ALG10 family [Tanacetum cinerariifolium]
RRRLVSNLCTLWIGSRHLHANVARFMRPPTVKSGGYTHQNDNNESGDEQSIGFIKEDFDGSDVKKEGDKNVSMVPDSMKEYVNVQAEEKGNDFDVNNSLDPFELYPLLNKKKNVEEKMDKSNGIVSIPFPPGFTPCYEAPTVLHEDNAVCIAQVRTCTLKVTKPSIFYRSFFTHDLQNNGDIIVQKIRSNDNLTDLFIKTLPTSTFKKLVYGTGMRQLSELKVYDVDRLASNLCTLWMGSHHLYANVARLRPRAVKSGGYTHQNDIEGIPLKLWSKSTFNKIAAKWGKMLYLEKLDEGCLYSKRLCILTSGKSNILETFKIIHKGKRFSVRAKETTGWIPDFDEQEEYNSESEDEQSIGFIKEDFDGSNVEKEGENNVSMVPVSVKED